MIEKSNKRVVNIEIEDDVKCFSITAQDKESKVVMREELSDDDLELVTGGVESCDRYDQDTSCSLKNRQNALDAANLINDIRSDAGLDSLNWDLNLENIADIRAEESGDVFSHTRPSGEAWNSVNSQITGGENLSFGYDDSNNDANAWMDSPTRQGNLTYDEFNPVATSNYTDNNGIIYYTQQFGFGD